MNEYFLFEDPFLEQYKRATTSAFLVFYVVETIELSNSTLPCTNYELHKCAVTKENYLKEINNMVKLNHLKYNNTTKFRVFSDDLPLPIFIKYE